MNALEERAWEAWAIATGVAYRDRQHGLCFYDGGTKQMSWRTWQGARATPPSPSTAPEVPPFPEALTLADVDYANNTPASWDPDYRRTWQQLQVAQATIRELRAYARQLRALASRPAELDAVRLLREARAVLETWRDVAPAVSLCADIDRVLAEQYRQGQRDAVAAYKQKQAALQELADQAQENEMGYGDAVAADRARRGEKS